MAEATTDHTIRPRQEVRHCNACTVRKSVFGWGQRFAQCLHGHHVGPTLLTVSLTVNTIYTHYCCYSTRDADALWAVNVATQFCTVLPPCHHRKMKRLRHQQCQVIPTAPWRTADGLCSNCGDWSVGREGSLKSV